MSEVIQATPVGTPVVEEQPAQATPGEQMAEEETIQATPVGEQVTSETLETDGLIDAFKEAFDKVADGMATNMEGEKKKENVFKRFANYIGSKEFKDDLNEKSEKYKVPPKALAKTFFGKVLALLGDALGIVVNTACSIVDTLVSVVSTILHSAVDIVAKAGNALSSLISCNKTNVATA